MRLALTTVLVAWIAAACAPQSPRCADVPILLLTILAGGNVCELDGPLENCVRDFGTLSTSGTLVTTFEAANASCVQLTIDDVSLASGTAPEFSLESDETAAELAPLDVFEIRLAFRPSASGETYSGGLVISSDAANADGPLTVDLAGAGE